MPHLQETARSFDRAVALATITVSGFNRHAPIEWEEISVGNAPKPNHTRTHSESSSCKKRLTGMGLVLVLGVLAGTQAVAETLDGASVRKLAHQGVWAGRDKWGGYWSWNADNSVCLRLFDQNGECSDTGSWKIVGDEICYELKWWGEIMGVRSQCVSVNRLSDIHYETRFHGGAMASTFFKFTVLIGGHVRTSWP